MTGNPLSACLVLFAFAALMAGLFYWSHCMYGDDRKRVRDRMRELEAERARGDWPWTPMARPPLDALPILRDVPRMTWHTSYERYEA